MEDDPTSSRTGNRTAETDAGRVWVRLKPSTVTSSTGAGDTRPNKPIPKEAERVANRLLYETSKTKEPKTDMVEDRQDPEEVEWVAQWTYGTVQRLAEKLKIGVEKWLGYPPEEIKESHCFKEKPKAEYLKMTFAEFIVKDQDFKLFTQPAGKWDRDAPDRWDHANDVAIAAKKRKKAELRAAARL
jgi:hypothetical protein